MYFLANSLENETCNAKVMIAIVIESLKRIENNLAGGTLGAGNLFIVNWRLSFE